MKIYIYIHICRGICKSYISPDSLYMQYVNVSIYIYIYMYIYVCFYIGCDCFLNMANPEKQKIEWQYVKSNAKPVYEISIGHIDIM